MLVPPFLKKGDKIAITCPGKQLPGAIPEAISLLESWGLEVILGETVTASYHQFAGTDELRTKDLQRFLDDNSIKAIIAARGGYGTIRIIDQLDFSNFEKNPKWIIGFSDITVLHSHVLSRYKAQSIHGQMPLNIPDATKPSLDSLRKALFGDELEYTIATNEFNKTGKATGILTGGNLTLLVMLNGSVSEVDFEDKILFVEDVGEYLYSIDRMFYALKRASKLAKLKGLIVGGFTGLKDNDISFGQTVQEIIVAHIAEYNYPVCFDFPAGHLLNNNSLMLGKTVQLDINTKFTNLKFI